ncbi:MAG: hypothetical protein RR549_00970 [Oscillospiraceae bacterium]
MTYPRLIITDKTGKTAVNCGLDMFVLDTESVRMKIREIYKDNKICASRHKAIEQVLREEFLMFCSSTDLIENEKPFQNLPEKYQKLLRGLANYDKIKLTYER